MDYQSLTDETLKNLSMMDQAMFKHGRDMRLKGSIFVLKYLSEAKRPVCPKELSKVSDVSTARIAALLGVLEQKGYVVRTFDENDRRKVRVTITQEGTNHLKVSTKRILDVWENVLRQLGENDAKEFLCLLKKINVINKEGTGQNVKTF